MRTRLFTRRTVNMAVRSFRAGINACRSVKLNREQVGIPPDGDFRLLEDGFYRLTESGDFRILE